jgi:hypothetical protein
VDWANLRLRVRSPKTERHSGKSQRVIPLFPELHAVLLDAFELADSGAEFVVSGYRDATANLRTQLLRIIERAGLEPWPRLFNAMRASRATELAAEYPAVVCTSWMGHTQAVAETHYHMVRDEDFDRATRKGGADRGAESGALGAQNASQQQAAGSGDQRERSSKIEQGPGFTPIPASGFMVSPQGLNGPGGTRTDLDSSSETVISGDASAECGADESIPELIELWHRVDTKTRAYLISVLRNASQRDERGLP